MVFKCFGGFTPDYLCDLIELYRLSRCLKSKDKLMLIVPKIRNRMGERAFNYCGPVVWNKLPIEIKEQTSLSKFSKLLKTHYINLAFN